MWCRGTMWGVTYDDPAVPPPPSSRLGRLLSSYDAYAGRCGVFDGELTCGRALGHLDRGFPHRFYDPSGSGRWVERDDFGRELARGRGHSLGDVRADEPSRARCALGHVLAPNPDPNGPPFIHGSLEELEVHAGCEDAAPVAAPARLEARGAELVDEAGDTVGMMRSPAVAHAVAAVYNGRAG